MRLPLYVFALPRTSMRSVLHFFALVDSPHRVRARSMAVNMCCKPRGDLARTTRSSAKTRHESVWSPTETPNVRIYVLDAYIKYGIEQNRAERVSLSYSTLDKYLVTKPTAHPQLGANVYHEWLWDCCSISCKE